MGATAEILKTIVYVRKNRAGKYDRTYHVTRECPMIKTKPHIGGVDMDELAEDLTARKKDMRLCKICGRDFLDVGEE